MPPTLVLLGTEDNLIPVEIGQKFEKNMENAGNPCRLVLYEGAAHGFFNYRDGDNPFVYQILEETIAFFKGLGWTRTARGT